MNIITQELQQAFEKSVEGTPDETPEICGYSGRGCRRMETAARSMLCLYCPLATYVDTHGGKLSPQSEVKAV